MRMGLFRRFGTSPATFNKIINIFYEILDSKEIVSKLETSTKGSLIKLITLITVSLYCKSLWKHSTEKCIKCDIKHVFQVSLISYD